MLMESGEKEEDDVVEFPISEELDLHMFRPQEVKDLVLDYLDLASQRGFKQVRIIHGKGVGTLRTQVHTLLSKHPQVLSFTLDTGRSGWGATVVVLR